MKIIARFATRGDGPDGTTGTVNLVLGCGYKGNTLKPNTIYEIREIMGELTVVEIGPGAARTKEIPHNLWDLSISQVIHYRDRWLLTLEEWQQARRTRQRG